MNSVPTATLVPVRPAMAAVTALPPGWTLLPLAGLGWFLALSVLRQALQVSGLA